MDELYRTVGRMEGKLDAVHADVTELKADMKEFKQFKWKVAGGITGLSMFITLLVEAFKAAK